MAQRSDRELSSCPRPDAVVAGEGGPPATRQSLKARLGATRPSEGEPPRWRPGFRHQGAALSGCGSSPPPSAFTIVGKMAQRKRPVKTAPTPPEADVRSLQETEGRSEADFLRDLDRASTDRSSE